MCVILDRGQVEGKRSWADQAAEVVGRWGEEKAFLVSCQNVWGHDEKHDGQTEKETVEADFAKAAQSAPALRRFSLDLQDGEQIHGRVVHLKEQRPFAVVVHRRAQQAVFVVHLCHGPTHLRVQGVAAQTRGDDVKQGAARREVLGSGRQLISMMGCWEQPTSSTGTFLGRGNKTRHEICQSWLTVHVWADAATYSYDSYSRFKKKSK